MARRKDADSEEEDRRREKRLKRRDDTESEEDDDSESEDDRSRRRKKSKSRSKDRKRSKESRKRSRSGERSRRRKKSRGDSDSESESADAGSESESGSEDERRGRGGKEVSEEELREYLAKKAQKKAQKLAKRLKQKSVSGYTNDNNPFGDSNLTETFVWRKKIEKEVIRGELDPRTMTLQNEKNRLASRMDEIEKVKKRREERALEKAQHEEEMALLARERARAEFQDWEQKEDEFHYSQAQVRSEIRLKEGRAKPIDVLARNLSLTGDFDIEVNEPYKIYRGLTVKEMEDLREDIKMHLEFDRNNPMHVEFWTCMMLLCNHEMAEATRRDILDRCRLRGEQPPPELASEEGRGVHGAVTSEVEEVMAVAGSRELAAMEERIAAKMERGSAKVVEYWEAVMKRLKVYKAKARLREIHADLLRQHLSLLEGKERGEGEGEEEGEEGGEGERRIGGEEGDREEEGEKREKEGDEPGSYSPELMTEEEARAEGGVIEGEEGKDKVAGGEGVEGGFSPELLHSYEGEDVVDAEADRQELERRRQQVLVEKQQQHRLAAGEAAEEVLHSAPQPAANALARLPAGRKAPAGAGTSADESVPTEAERAAANKAMGADPGDAVLGRGAEVNLDAQVYWWHDKFRPRKPKYFNRVHTGYEWNKYNQTHYDHDNPPPKIVQGYKFNIFYPDLIDRSTPPSYHIERDGSDGETCLIRFHAGPPYEDIAFRIVNKEWEYSHKKGFKCTFERGILHIYFNFVRHRHRR